MIVLEVIVWALLALPVYLLDAVMCWWEFRPWSEHSARF